MSRIEISKNVKKYEHSLNSAKKSVFIHEWTVSNWKKITTNKLTYLIKLAKNSRVSSFSWPKFSKNKVLIGSCRLDTSRLMFWEKTHYLTSPSRHLDTDLIDRSRSADNLKNHKMLPICYGVTHILTNINMLSKFGLLCTNLKIFLLL